MTPYICSECDLRFWAVESFTAHVRDEHPADWDGEEET